MTTVLALEVRELNYSFGNKQVLDQVEIAVREGECMMLLGPNGAGKTTLFSLITRLYDSGYGTIRIAGHDLKRAPLAALARIGVVFQQATLDLDLSVLQNLRYHGALHGLGGRLLEVRIQDELERQNMFDRRDERVRQLNGGHRRRVEIARALLHEPAVLLLDEPTVGLDIPSRKAIVEYMHALCSEKAIAVLWATHLIDEISDDDHLTVIHQGQIRAQGAVGKILDTLDAETVEVAFRKLTTASGEVK